MLNLIVFLVLFVFGLQAHSNEAQIENIAKKEKVSAAQVEKSLKEGCDSGITPFMVECGRYHWIGADISLNDVYQKLLKHLASKSAKTKLINAQKAWLLFRDKTCEYESDGMASGTGYSVLYYGCLTTVTTERNARLKSYLACEDFGCPGIE